ncbi:Bardet-Biedl syndrome 10 protein isoform X1 [Esox lucius]|uniref:Bardet-Biedl syndrome 10 protein isoform X1 n=1 Tax=Esox lucius TaxID=8010 RepID=UPI001476D265|nr:Bardet-Biedl syndrome 10 protein isoform X1 [Esox lucius]
MQMQPECLRLDSVLQTVSVLEAVVQRSFGPDGGQVLFTRDTGQTLLTRHGTRILTALRLDHPLVRMVVECVRKHSDVTGDGSKTFILLLASLLREIRKHNGKAPKNVAGAKWLGEALLAFGLDELSNVISVGVASHATYLSDTCNPTHTDTRTVVKTDTGTLRRLLGSFLHTRISPTHVEVISQLTCELLCRWSFQGSFVNEHFPSLHTAVSGFPTGCSRLLEGQVIHADFSTPLPVHNRGQIKALTVTEHLEPSPLIGGAVLELGGTSGGMESVCARSGQRLDSVCAVLHQLGVSLLLSSVTQSEATLAAARRNGVGVLECVPEDDLSLFCLLSGSQPITDWATIRQEDVATVTFCQSLVLGARRFVHLGFPKAEGKVQPHSLVVCGLTEGQTEQSVDAIRDALLMLHTAWQPTHRPTATDETPHTDRQTDASTDTCTGQVGPGCVISIGGTFEFLLHHALQLFPHANKHTRSHSDTPDVSRMLAEALLSVPRRIYSHSSRQYLAAHSHALSSIRSHFTSLNRLETTAVLAAGGSNGVPGEAGSGSGSVVVKEVLDGCSSGCSLGVESVSCKYQLILAVLQCLRNILCVDTVLHTASHKILPTSLTTDDDDS